MKFINCGFGNLVAAERIVSAACPDAAPIKRLIQDAKDSARAVDLCCGKRCRSVLILDSGHVVLCAITVDSLAVRLAGGEVNAEEEES